MKKVLALVLILMLVLAALPVASLADQQDDPLARYVSTGNTGKLLVRTAPRTHTDNVITKLENGTRVVVMEFVENNTWAKIEFTFNKKTEVGYVQNRYLSTVKPAPMPAKPTPTATPNPTINFKTFKHVPPYLMQVKPATPGGFVNLRWAPSKAHLVMDKLYADAEVTVIAQNSTWAQIIDNQTGHVGYMMLSFLKQK